MRIYDGHNDEKLRHRERFIIMYSVNVIMIPLVLSLSIKLSRLRVLIGDTRVYFVPLQNFPCIKPFFLNSCVTL